MNIYSVPMLISGVMCTVIAAVTWMFRRRENINRVFSFFTLALALDSFAFFLWFQFGSVENIQKWVRTTFTLGFLIPIALILFFFAFTGYEKRPAAKVLRIRVGHFRRAALLFVVSLMFLSQFSDLIIDTSKNPANIWDVEFGAVGDTLFSLFALIFVYLFAMAYKSYKSTGNGPRRRFILLLSIGTMAWLLSGYIGAVVFSPSSESWNAANYLGTTLMAIFYFVAIVNYQSDKVTELNISLERKVEDRTRELSLKNTELEDTLDQLKRMQQQVIIQEKMASLGQLVAGVMHDFNTPLGAIRSMRDTKSRAVMKLQTTLEGIDIDSAGAEGEIKKSMKAILKADQVMDEGTGRLSEIISNLKNFTKLDESEKTNANVHDGIESALALIEHDLAANIEVVREYGEIPRFVCDWQKLNHVFLNLLRNACQAIEDKGCITITTSLKDSRVHVAIRDTGSGIEQDDLGSIFDPGFTTKGAVVRARLGLSSCQQIVQELRGEINVESRPGIGSVFTVILPV
jgi:signal transduction histidine kinase